MPMLQTGHESRFSSSSEVRRYTVYHGSEGGEMTVEASELKCAATIEDIPDRHYCLSRPIVIEVEREESGYVIAQPDTGIFAYSEDLKVAMDQFYGAFIEEYEFLKDNANQLSPSLRHDLQTFESMIRPR